MENIFIIPLNGLVLEKKIILIPRNNPTGNIAATYTIVSNGRNFITVDEAINENINNYFIIFLLDEKNQLVRDSQNILEFYKYSPITENLYDIYLDTTAIIGIESSYAMLGST